MTPIKSTTANFRRGYLRFLEYHRPIAAPPRDSDGKLAFIVLSLCTCSSFLKRKVHEFYFLAKGNYVKNIFATVRKSTEDNTYFLNGSSRYFVPSKPNFTWRHFSPGSNCWHGDIMDLHYISCGHPKAQDHERYVLENIRIFV